MEANSLLSEHKAMVAKLAKPGEDILTSLTPEKCHLWHMVTGVAGEAGEILDYQSDANLLEELGDMEFYLQALRVEFMPLEYEPPVAEDQHLKNMVAPPIQQVDIASSHLLDMVKKYVVYNKPLTEMVGKIVGAISDLDVHLAILYKTKNFTREQAWEHNLNKLLKGERARYSEGKYTDQQAQDRNDKDGED